MDSASPRRHLIIHGHFYQPPRENPWTERIERQGGAAPYHDWNEKIVFECYQPNAFSRRLDNWGRITRLVNNYEWISFNFGPTLISWLEESSPEVYAKILEADRTSAARLGHGNAIAQAYNHLIMPLASRRDQETQVRWGVYDFERRFGRAPEGMWLPETAINETTLDILISFGLRFVILSPHQALRVRPLAGRPPGGEQAQKQGGGGAPGQVGQGDAAGWKDVSNGSIQTGLGYRCFAPGAQGKRDTSRSIAVFFYDAGLSTDVSFNHLLRNGDNLADAISLGYGRSGSDLVVIATDGEIYGHHEPFADMALSYLADFAAPRRGVAMTNFAAYLDGHEPQFEVELMPGPNGEGTSWSCFHGVGRWKEDCGDSTGGRPGWNQRWRSPLRAGLNTLNESLAAAFEKETTGLLKDPWTARNDYIRVIEERTPGMTERFLAEHAARALAPAERAHVLMLLESQRNAELMFTSCGWFFSDISGIETVQILRYAARAIELAGSEHWLELEKRLLSQLKAAVSNVASQGTGAAIYANSVRASIMNRPCLSALYAISAHLEGRREAGSLYGNPITPLDEIIRHVDRDTVKIGSLAFTSRLTFDTSKFEYLVYGEDEAGFTCFVRETRGEGEYRALVETLVKLAEAGSRDELRDAASHLFGKRFTIRHFLAEDRERVLHQLSRNRIAAIEQRFADIYAESRNLLRLLLDAKLAAPPSLLVPAQAHLTRRLVDEVERWDRSLVPESIGGIRSVLGEAASFGVPVDKGRPTAVFSDRILEKISLLESAPDPGEAAAIGHFIDVIEEMGITFDFKEIQNRIYAILVSKVQPAIAEIRRGGPSADGRRRSIEAFLRLAERFNFNVDVWRRGLEGHDQG
jgi:hypothetical protein